MNKLIVGVVITLIIAVGAFFVLNSSSTITGIAVEDAVKVFVVDSSHLRFFIDGVENPNIVVKQGDRVRIEFSSSEGFHDWKIDEFNVATEKVNPGRTTSVEFVADKKGTFEYYCSVGQHRANGMFGKFVVE